MIARACYADCVSTLDISVLWAANRAAWTWGKELM